MTVEREREKGSGRVRVKKPRRWRERPHARIQVAKNVWAVTDYTLAESQSPSEHLFQIPYCFIISRVECIGAISEHFPIPNSSFLLFFSFSFSFFPLFYFSNLSRPFLSFFFFIFILFIILILIYFLTHIFASCQKLINIVTFSCDIYIINDKNEENKLYNLI